MSAKVIDIGTAVAHIQQGILQVDATLKRTDEGQLTAGLHNLLDGILSNYKQDIVAHCRRDIHGWVDKHIQ